MNSRALPLLLFVLYPLSLLGGREEWRERLSNIISSRAAGEYSTAIRLSEEALKLAERESGRSEGYYFMSLSQLGSSYQMSGDLEKAEAIFTRALEEKETLLGSDHPSVAASLFQLGQVRLRQGDRDQAESLFNRANAISLAHPESNQMLESMAFSFRDRDRVMALEERYLFELSAYEMELGDDHPELLGVLDNLGMLYRFQGRYEEAIQVFSRMLTIQERGTESSAEAMRRCVDQLVQCYRAEDRYEDADALVAKFSNLSE